MADNQLAAAVLVGPDSVHADRFRRLNQTHLRQQKFDSPNLQDDCHRRCGGRQDSFGEPVKYLTKFELMYIPWTVQSLALMLPRNENGRVVPSLCTGSVIGCSITITRLQSVWTSRSRDSTSSACPSTCKCNNARDICEQFSNMYMKRYAHTITTRNICRWDTAGQERFKCIAASYYRGANGKYLFCHFCLLHSSYNHVDRFINKVKFIS